MGGGGKRGEGERGIGISDCWISGRLERKSGVIVMEGNLSEDEARGGGSKVEEKEGEIVEKGGGGRRDR